MWHDNVRKVTGLLALVCLSFGCATAMVPVPSGIRVQQGAFVPSGSRAIPGVDLGHPDGATIRLQLRLPTFRNQAVPATTASDVTSYAIELVDNLPGDGGLNLEGLPNYSAGVGSGMNDYSAATAKGSYAMPAADANKQMQFTGVPAGTYRVRVKAIGPGLANITAPSPDAGPGGSNQLAVSTNSVTVANGAAPAYNNSAPNSGSGSYLEVQLQLQHGSGDAIPTTISVADGAAIPTIGSSDGNI